ncbi:hypothetical protein H310_10364 [Aphanomyces invadans]|uniref:Calcineurin-like phosphoesterase domain-containing protein n=1 Tax=Aphanomyces invadans TaxID=157072 RepID=A0A024TQ50_9STRA|nr:hypothetical protein H310_10364 [Aphanomyces invadans]ETV96163.1 hypothetical protein H310_10364 [Aphanomyces invadans]|eukprot:XP_008874955.1 hypothetical protein H310_10364 [Aphanomyces invadans]
MLTTVVDGVSTLSPLQAFLVLACILIALLLSACYTISIYSSPIALLAFGFGGYSLLQRLATACGVLSPQPHVGIQAPDAIRFVCISDTRGKHDRVKLPPGDVLLHAGNFVSHGSQEEVARFNTWLGSLPYRRKIVISGHLETQCPISWAKILTNCDYLDHSSVSIDGVSIFGCPSVAPDRLHQIPAHTDVVVTSAAPFGILDKTLVDGTHVGDETLLKQILTRIRPKLHVFGSVQEAYGKTVMGTTTFVNASVTTYMRQPSNAAWIIDLPRRSAKLSPT